MTCLVLNVRFGLEELEQERCFMIFTTWGEGRVTVKGVEYIGMLGVLYVDSSARISELG